MINDEINKLQKELHKIVRELDKNPLDTELKRLRKNLKERIRIKTKKLMEEITPATTVMPVKVVKEKTTKTKRQGSMKEEVLKLIDKLDNQQIHAKTGYPIKSIQWYRWKYGNN